MGIPWSEALTTGSLLGVKAGYTGFKGVELFLDARNLTNTMYMSNVNVIGNATAASQLSVELWVLITSNRGRC